MKYNDNGTIKELKAKVYDTLPIGTEVDYTGSVVPDGWTEVQNPDLYAVGLEVKTNKVYKNGNIVKPIYRKVYEFATSDNMDLETSHGLTNLDKIWIDLGASCVENEIETLPVNWYYSSNDWARAWAKRQNIRFKCPGSLGTNRTLRIVLEYTKTTD